ncbi:alpha/beta hydrolase [Streptomyces chartreusis]|uniref:alpha/beta hydrolase n=1 Tax=Streptomyces chartreusis TaxID=1969 RepID=UPI0036294D08
MRPPYDPELVAHAQAFQENMPRLGPDVLSALRVPSESAVLPELASGQLLVDEHRVPGAADAPEIPVLVYRPASSSGSLPCVYYIHGGAMVTGNPPDGVGIFSPAAVEIGAVIVSVGYRLAPEHPHPAPVEDCYRGLVWTAENARQLGIDPERIMIAGVSAGGGLAAGTALLARDRGFPALTHQILACPMLDDRLRTPSYEPLDPHLARDRTDYAFGWDSLLGADRGGPDVSSYAAPARETDLADLPRTYLDVGSAEAFRDEVIDYAARLSRAGVSVDLHLWGGGFHGFDLMAPDARVSQAARATRHEFISRALGT